MINKNIIDAVSPLKKRSKSYKGGTSEKKAATATSKRRAGFAKSTATSNKPGYNAQTKFKPTTKSAGPGKPATVPSPTKPYQFGPDGKLGPVTNNYINTDNSINGSYNTDNDATINGGTEGHWEETTEVKELESYDDFWTSRIDSGDHSKGMKQYIKKHGGDLDAARKEWEIVSRKHEKSRNKNRKTTTNRKYIKGTTGDVQLNQSGYNSKNTNKKN